MLTLGRLPRSTQPELLDQGTVETDALRRNLADMAMLNRLPGGVGTSVAVVERLASDAPDDTPVLDVGTGIGDFARRFRRRSARPIIASDVDERIVELARSALGALADVRLLCADIRSLPLAKGSVAVAHASLVLHHLGPADAIAALREMGRVARHGVVINDLQRSRQSLLMTALPVLGLSRSPITRHDGLLSVRRAYTPAELDDLAAAAGLRRVSRTSTWWPRVTTVYR